MKRKFLTANGAIAALLLIFLSICLAFGVWLAQYRPVYADEATQMPAAQDAEKVENYWEVTPNLVSWKWGEFDPAINRISARAAYGNETLQFMICHLPDGSDEEIEVITYDNYEGLVPSGSSNDEKMKGLFALDKNGEMPEAVTEKLKTLDYGTYSLLAHVAETEEVTGLGNGVDPNNGFTFNVLKGQNRWTVSPYIVPWNWGEFKLSRNTISAVPAYFNDGDKVRFSIYKGVSYADPALGSFYTVNGYMSNGVADVAEAEKVLNSLDAGNYYLRAYFPGTENYDAIDERVQFTVRQVQNYWTTTPNVVQWTWSEYKPEVNVISAVPAYHPVTGAQVVYGIYKDRECRIPMEDNGKLENFTVVNEERAELISKLNAGTYYLQAETRYSSINYTDVKAVIPFTVQTIQNTWTTTPNIVQWKYGEYDSSVNIIVSAAKFENGDVTYGIYTDAAHRNAVEGLESFTQVNSDIGAKLGALDAGTYYLYASSEQAGNNAQTPNFTKLETETAVEFRILPLQNNWTTTPSVLPWKYGDYSRTANLISAVPAVGDSAHISVYDADGVIIGFVNSENKTVTSFELVQENGLMLVPEFVEKRLGGLDAGIYYMLASVEGSVNYTGLNNYNSPADIKEHAIKFEITAVANSWKSIPAVLSWSEGHFSDKNKISAEAAFGDDNIVIIVYDSEGKVITSNQNNTELDYDKISALGIGLYKVTFSISETGNYSSLMGEIEFSVMEDSVALGGIIAATIVFAVLDVIAAGVCITLMIIRRRKIEERFRQMVHRELHGGKI